MKDLLEKRDQELVDALCGPKHHPISSRYRRAGTIDKPLATRLGRITVHIARVRDQDNGRILTPLWDDVVIRRGIFQRDVIQLAVEGVQRMTYRNTLEELNKTVGCVMSPMSLNRYVIEEGENLNATIQERELDTEAVQTDGTKLPMGNKKHHEVNVTLAVNQDGTSRVRCITVGQDWKPHREAIDHTRFVDKEGQSSPAKVVTDLEKGLADALTPDEAFWGPCHIHVVRYVGQSLWSDGLPQGERKKTILGTVQGLLAHLRNSLDLHLPKGETREIQHRITQTTKEFRRLATLIFDEGLKKTARFLRRAATMVTTFATLALQGQWIPWNTNRVERVMLEVSKRCKHRGMNWTSHGGQAILTLLVVRFVEPETYQEHQRRRLHGPETYKTDIAIQVVVT